MNKKNILITVGIVLIICCIVTFVMILLFKDPIMNLIFPKPTPTVFVSLTPTPTPMPDISGQWSGSYIVSSPRDCAGTGTWDATLLQQNGTISGAYSSDIGLGGSVNGTVSGSDFSWNVGGSGGVTFIGNLKNNLANGNFTGPICSGNTHTSGTFTGSKQ